MHEDEMSVVHDAEHTGHVRFDHASYRRTRQQLTIELCDETVQLLHLDMVGEIILLSSRASME
jgi:hypothetical protein